MENKSSNGWKFFALLFGALLAGVIGLYVYKQQNPDYDPWEEPWENSSSPVDLGLTKDAEEAKEATWGEKQGKDGQITKEYDSKCASIELKAVEYAVRLSGLLNEEREEEIQVVLGAETKELSG